MVDRQLPRLSCNHVPHNDFTVRTDAKLFSMEVPPTAPRSVPAQLKIFTVEYARVRTIKASKNGKTVGISHERRRCVDYVITVVVVGKQLCRPGKTSDLIAFLHYDCIALTYVNFNFMPSFPVRSGEGFNMEKLDAASTVVFEGPETQQCVLISVGFHVQHVIW